MSGFGFKEDGEVDIKTLSGLKLGGVLSDKDSERIDKRLRELTEKPFRELDQMRAESDRLARKIIVG